MPSLKETVRKQLKENIPLSEIRRSLQQKGYGSDAISRAVREVIGGMNESKMPAHRVQLVVLAIGIVIAIGAGYYVATGNVFKPSPVSTLCDGQVEVDGVSCRAAMDSVSQKYSGAVVGVSYTNGAGLQMAPRHANEDYWKISVALSEPVAFGDIMVSGNVDVIVNKDTGDVVLYRYGE